MSLKWQYELEPGMCLHICHCGYTVSHVRLCLPFPFAMYECVLLYHLGIIK